MSHKDSCDIILPTCGELKLVRGCVESLMISTSYPYRLIVVYNSNQKETLEYLRGLIASGKMEIKIIEPGENLGWIRSINKALEISKDSKYVCLQNDDTVFTKGWLEELVGMFEKYQDIGIANPEWEKPDGVSIDEYAASLKRYKGQAVDTDWCRGHSFLIKREVIERIGPLDTAYLPGYYDDRDYSLKAIKAGYRCVRAKAAFVYHLRNVTMKRAIGETAVLKIMDVNGKTFYKRWGYPQKIIFVLKNTEIVKEMLRRICLDQNKVIIIMPKGSDIVYEHTNIKIIKFSPFLFGLKVFLYIATRRSKKSQKAVDFIFTDDKNFFSFTKPLERFIAAGVIFEENVVRLSEKAFTMIKDKKEKDKNLIR